MRAVSNHWTGLLDRTTATGLAFEPFSDLEATLIEAKAL